MTTPVLLDRWGRPIQRAALTAEVAAPTLTGIRSPISGYPADGLNPLRLASILREADQGEPLRYLELAETIEERDPHYLGVLGTRRRSVSQVDVSVTPASDAARDVQIADMVRDWLARDELTEEVFHILDAIGKGYSFTEIVWDTSEGQWLPARLERRDPRHFRFERRDLATPTMLDEGGREVPLPPFKFVFAVIAAKSGLPIRSGLARVGAWGWMFKAFTQRDWAIFTQTYGQPLRVGKFGPGASEADRETLFRAVANIAGDCAAIIPESMTIEFVETGSVGATADLYEARSDWLDRQISKAVLGQTATTDAEVGGLGSGKEHRAVQEDIERADCKALAAILNRDLIRPWIDLEYGPQKKYPQLVIARPEAEDLGQLATALGTLVPLGLKVSASEIRGKFGLKEPTDEEEILAKEAPAPIPADPADPAGSLNGQRAKFKRGSGLPGMETAPQAEGAPVALPEAVSAEADPVDLQAVRLAREAEPAIGVMVDRIEAMLAAADSLAQFREMLLAGFPDLDETALREVMAPAIAAALAGGRAMVADESG